MANYKINDAALDDIATIFSFGIDTFGLEAAITYVEGLKRQFAEIAQNPLLYQAVNEIRKGYRRSVYRSHSIYYQIDGGITEVMAVIGGQDVTARL